MPTPAVDLEGKTLKAASNGKNITDISPEIERVTIPDRIYGFPGVALGGYTAGILASRLGAKQVRVDFRRPLPSGSTVNVTRLAGSGLSLSDHDGSFAVARAREISIAVPAVPTWNDAEAAVEEHFANADITHRDCYGCGPDRRPGDGFRLFPGIGNTGEVVVSTWIPDSGLSGDCELPTEYVWALLDCPGHWACRRFGGARGATVTLYLAATQYQPIRLDKPHVVFGWLVSQVGPKYQAGSAIATADGEICAVAEALWYQTNK